MFAARNCLLAGPSLVLPAGPPTFVSKADGGQHVVWGNAHSCNWNHDLTAVAGGVLLVPTWINSTSWLGIAGSTRTLTSSLGDTFTSAGLVDAYSGSGSEAHGGIELWYKLNPTAGTHTLTFNASNSQNFQVNGGGSLFYSGIGSVTQSGMASGAPSTNRTFNVTSATGRLTLGFFGCDGGSLSGNGTSRWAATSSNNEGWVDKLLIQEIAGASSVTHTASHAGGGWGLGFDLAP